MQPGCMNHNLMFWLVTSNIAIMEERGEKNRKFVLDVVAIQPRLRQVAFQGNESFCMPDSFMEKLLQKLAFF